MKQAHSLWLPIRAFVFESDLTQFFLFVQFEKEDWSALQHVQVGLLRFQIALSCCFV
jgi:hypothetical protein